MHRPSNAARLSPRAAKLLTGCLARRPRSHRNSTARSSKGPSARPSGSSPGRRCCRTSIAGLQGIIDHAMVGHFVGYTANAAIGVSWQIILVVIVFISSLFTGMAVLVARFAGAERAREGESRRLPGVPHGDRACRCCWPPVGYFASPLLLDIVNAAPEVQARGAAVPAHRCSSASSA